MMFIEKTPPQGCNYVLKTEIPQGSHLSVCHNAVEVVAKMETRQDRIFTVPKECCCCSHHLFETVAELELDGNFVSLTKGE